MPLQISLPWGLRPVRATNTGLGCRLPRAVNQGYADADLHKRSRADIPKWRNADPGQVFLSNARSCTEPRPRLELSSLQVNRKDAECMCGLRIGETRRLAPAASPSPDARTPAARIMFLRFVEPGTSTARSDHHGLSSYFRFPAPGL